MGFDLVEIPVEDPELINGNEVVEALNANDLKASICGVFGPTKDLTADDTQLHENCFKYLRKCFELGNVLGTKFVAGPMYSAVGKARLVPQEQRNREWSRAVENLSKVCLIAEQFGQEIALEPLNRFESDLINTADDVLKLVNDINHPSAKVILDGFHMTIEESDIRKAINTVGDHLIHIQISENHRGIPGTGLTPWSEFAKGLLDINYQGSIVIESFTPENKELAAAVCIWKNLAKNQDEFASKGLAHMKTVFKN